MTCTRWPIRLVKNRVVKIVRPKTWPITPPSPAVGSLLKTPLAGCRVIKPLLKQIVIIVNCIPLVFAPSLDLPIVRLLIVCPVNHSPGLGASTRYPYSECYLLLTRTPLPGGTPTPTLSSADILAFVIACEEDSNPAQNYD